MNGINRWNRPTLWTDEGLPVVRLGSGRVVLRGTSLTDGTDAENAEYIRKLLDTQSKVIINGRAL